MFKFSLPKVLKNLLPKEEKYFGIYVDQFASNKFAIRLNITEFEKYYGENSAHKYFDFGYSSYDENITVYYLRTYSHSTWEARQEVRFISKYESLSEIKKDLKKYFEKKNIVPKLPDYNLTIQHKLW